MLKVPDEHSAKQNAYCVYVIFSLGGYLMVCNPRTGKPHDTGSRQQYNGRTPEDWLMRYDEKRWAELRAKRKAGPPLTATERDEWDMLNAERLIILGRTRRQAVATRQRKRRNAMRMELGRTRPRGRP